MFINHDIFYNISTSINNTNYFYIFEKLTKKM